MWRTFLFILALIGTENSLREEQPELSRRFFFVGHTYDHQGEGKRIDPRLEGLNFQQYDRIILGGDVCSEATQDRSTLSYLDSIFQLGSPNTYYVIGNHDARNGNLDWYQQFTRRRSFFVDSREGLVTVVLNTTLNPADCQALDDQYRMLKSVCDTISAASHLLIFHHHAIATRVPGIPDNWFYANWPYYHWDANCFAEDPSYMAAIYPLLTQVHDRGIEVVNISGDLGLHRKTMDTTSTDGIHYLACGIDNSRYARDPLRRDTMPKDSVLIFEHDPAKRELTWKFQDLDELWEADQGE